MLVVAGVVADGVDEEEVKDASVVVAFSEQVGFALEIGVLTSSVLLKDFESEGVVLREESESFVRSVMLQNEKAGSQNYYQKRGISLS